MSTASNVEVSRDTVSDLYLDLMKRCLTNWIYADVELVYHRVEPVKAWKRWLVDKLRGGGMELVWAPKPIDQQDRMIGGDTPTTAHTMVGMKRLDNFQSCIETVIREDIPGDIIETGVWRGGASIFARAVLKAHGVTDRKVWVADSFEGLPPPDTKRFPQDAGALYHTFPGLAISLERVKANFERYGLLDDQVVFLKGFFADTMPTVACDRFSVLRLDGDMYGSTMDALTNLYPKLSPGGFVIIDDYQIEACRNAVTDFRRDREINDPLERIDVNAVYWRRSS